MSDNFFEVLDYLVMAVGFGLALSGMLTLLATWLAPRLLDHWLFQPRVIDRFPRTKANLTITACGTISWGVYLVISTLDSNPRLTVCVLIVAMVLTIPFSEQMRSKRDV